MIFDRADVIEGARRAVAKSGMAERIELVSGDFFGNVPGDGDLCLLKSILHDWLDDKCEKSVHRAAPAGSRLVVVELLLPDTPQPSPVTLMDMNMLVMLGGRERTAGEYSGLLQRSGCGDPNGRDVQRDRGTAGVVSFQQPCVSNLAGGSPCTSAHTPRSNRIST